GLQRMTLNLSAWVHRMYLFGMFIQVLSYAKVLLIPIFLWSLTRCLRAPGLTYNVETLLKISLWIVALGILSQLLFRLPLSVVMYIFTPLSWVNTLLGLAQTVWTLLILINVRRAIADKLDSQWRRKPRLIVSRPPHRAPLPHPNPSTQWRNALAPVIITPTAAVEPHKPSVPQRGATHVQRCGPLPPPGPVAPPPGRAPGRARVAGRALPGGQRARHRGQLQASVQV